MADLFFSLGSIFHGPYIRFTNCAESGRGEARVAKYQTGIMTNDEI